MIASANSQSASEVYKNPAKNWRLKKILLFKQEWFPLARYRDESLPTLSFKSPVNKIGPDNTPYFWNIFFLGSLIFHTDLW